MRRLTSSRPAPVAGSLPRPRVSVGAVLAAFVVPSGPLSGGDEPRTGGRLQEGLRRRSEDTSSPQPRAPARSSTPTARTCTPTRSRTTARARPQRPATKNAVSRAAVTTGRRDRRPDDPAAGASRGRRRGRAARADRAEAVQRPRERRPRLLADQTATTCSTPATACSRTRTGRWLTDADVALLHRDLDRRRRTRSTSSPPTLGRYLLYSRATARFLDGGQAPWVRRKRRGPATTGSPDAERGAVHASRSPARAT